MFNALMKVQWKWSRVALLVGALLGFTVPLFSVRRLVEPTGSGLVTVADVVVAMQQVAPMYSILAAAVGLAVALLAWSADHKGRHVYALSLPVTRARYALMRFGAGAVFLLVPAAGLLIGSLVAIGIAVMPAGLHAYPIALTLRFLLCSGVAFAVFFAIAASSQKAAGTILAAACGVVLLAFFLETLGVKTDLLNWMGVRLFTEPGIFSVFGGRWMLIDV